MLKPQQTQGTFIVSITIKSQQTRLQYLALSPALGGLFIADDPYNLKLLVPID